MGSKKKKPPSWKRRKADSSKTDAPTRPKASGGGVELALNKACAEAKAACTGARDRHRKKEDAKEGDEELIASYSEAKAAMKTFHQAKQTPNGDNAPATDASPALKQAPVSQGSSWAAEGVQGESSIRDKFLQMRQLQDRADPVEGAEQARSLAAVGVAVASKPRAHGSFGEPARAPAAAPASGKFERTDGLLTAEVLGASKTQRRLAKKAFRREQVKNGFGDKPAGGKQSGGKQDKWKPGDPPIHTKRQRAAIERAAVDADGFTVASKKAKAPKR